MKRIHSKCSRRFTDQTKRIASTRLLGVPLDSHGYYLSLTDLAGMHFISFHLEYSAAHACQTCNPAQLSAATCGSCKGIGHVKKNTAPLHKHHMSPFQSHLPLSLSLPLLSLSLSFSLTRLKQEDETPGEVLFSAASRHESLLSNTALGWIYRLAQWKTSFALSLHNLLRQMFGDAA